MCRPLSEDEIEQARLNQQRYRSIIQHRVSLFDVQPPPRVEQILAQQMLTERQVCPICHDTKRIELLNSVVECRDCP